MDEPLKTCGLCGRKFPGVEGQAHTVISMVGVDVDLCHPTNWLPSTGPTCYQRWTVYGERPDTAEKQEANRVARAHVNVLEILHKAYQLTGVEPGGITITSAAGHLGNYKCEINFEVVLRLIEAHDEKAIRALENAHRCDLLADALGRLLVRMGGVSEVPLTGSQLLLDAEDVLQGLEHVDITFEHKE